MKLMLFLFVFICSTFANALQTCKQEVLYWPEFRDIHSQDSTPEIYKNAYDVVKSLLSFQEKPRIEKIIHQIWLDGPVPEKFDYARESWLIDHPDWKYKLWSAKEVRSLKIYNTVVFQRAPNIQMKEDIIKLEILYQYGGLFVSIDRESFFSHDVFHHTSDFYLGFSHTDSDTDEAVSSSVLGACKKNDLIRRAMLSIRRDARKIKPNKPLSLSQIQEISGSKMLTNIVKKHMSKEITKNQNFNCVVLPKSFFYNLDLSDDSLDTNDLMDFSFMEHLNPWTYSIQMNR